MRCAKKDRALAGTSVSPRKDSRRVRHLMLRFSQRERGRTPHPYQSGLTIGSRYGSHNGGGGGID
jgi:hypothetical protein